MITGTPAWYLRKKIDEASTVKYYIPHIIITIIILSGIFLYAMKWIEWLGQWLLILIPLIIYYWIKTNYTAKEFLYRIILWASAEMKVATILENISKRYWENMIVINDYKNNKWNIDHIVIYKNSYIFLIETKWGKSFRKFDELKKQIFGQKYFIKNLLDTDQISNVVCFTDKYISGGIERNYIFSIVKSDFLPKFLNEEIEKIEKIGLQIPQKNFIEELLVFQKAIQ